MNDGSGGKLSSEEQQKKTAAEIARKKVLAAYKHVPISSTHTPDLKEYHSAWQNYYQKYYSEYYSKAAKNYIEKERQNVATTPAPAPQEVLKNTIEEKASDKAARRRRFKKYRPIMAGAVVVLALLFLQYNRLIFAPLAAYVSPGNDTDTSITAIDPTIATNVGDEERLIIPKLNIDVPILFGLPNDSDSIMEGMNNGVVHWSIPGASALPGEIGNLVITGHSAGDIYTSNQYKFIFSGLERLTENDLIYVDYGGVRYTYAITGLETVEPTEVSKLVYETNKPMLTLITCTPLGTSRYRLLVSAEQIAPTPSGTTQAPQVDSGATEMVGNAPTFFETIGSFFFGKHD